MDLENLGIPEYLDGRLWPYRSRTQVPIHHRHVELEVNLVLQGGATYLLEGAIYELSSGSLFWQCSAADHALLRVTENLQMWIAVFRPEMLRRICPPEMTDGVLRDRPTDRVLKQISPEAVDELDTLAEAMQAFDDDGPRYNAALAYWLLSAWTAHRQGEAGAAGGDVHPAVDRAARRLRSEEAPPDMKTLARQAGLSPSHLSRLFAQQIGLTIVEYRQRVRLERFREIFGRGRRYNMTQAALRAGFGSYPQFHRVFKQHFGFSPAEYRKRLTE